MKKIIYLLLLPFFVCSCGLEKDIAISRANALFKESKANKAAALYLKAGSNYDALPAYNLANVLMFLGEVEAAEELFTRAIHFGTKDIQARAFYNLGVSAYSNALYDKAAEFFKNGILVYKGDKNRNKREEELRKELSRAYEMAINAEQKKQESHNQERSKLMDGPVDGIESPFAISDNNNKSLFSPASSKASSGEDH